MDAVNRFVQARRDLMETVSRIPQKRAGEPVCGEWSAKCLLAHIAGWDAYFIMILRLLRTGNEVPYRGDQIGKWNRIMVKRREGKSWETVKEEFVRGGEEMLGEYSRLEEGLRSRRFWTGKEPTPAWVLKNNAEHYDEHRLEIERKLAEWADIGGGLGDV